MIEPTQESDEEVQITGETRTPNRDGNARARNQGTPKTPNPNAMAERNETIDITDGTVEISSSMELEERSSQTTSPETMMSISGASSLDPEVEILNESHPANVTPAVFTSEDIRAKPGYSPPTQRTPRESTRAKPLVGSPLTDVDRALGRPKVWANSSDSEGIVEVTRQYIKKIEETALLKAKLRGLRSRIEINKVIVEAIVPITRILNQTYNPKMLSGIRHLE